MSTNPFEDCAEDYDATFTQTRLGAWLRSAVWSRADTCFTETGRLLEIGCGTGEDAIHLASLGHNVLATDASASMIALAQAKVERTPFSSRIEFMRIPMRDLRSALKGESFDGAFSNFGAVNCASGPASLISDAASLLRPGAMLLWVVMGKFVPWEWAWYLTRLNKAAAFRRLSRDGTNWRGMRIRYATPSALKRALSPLFHSIRTTPLGFVLPPTYAADWLNRRPRFFAALAAVERVAGAIEPLSALADHYIVEARRGSAVADA